MSKTNINSNKIIPFSNSRYNETNNYYEKKNSCVEKLKNKYNNKKDLNLNNINYNFFLKL